MKKESTRELVLSALFITVGVILPIVFHNFGSGSVFLPMHIPVLISGFFLNPVYALLVGMLTPILSSLITSMPPVFPVLPFMIFELATYGFVVSILDRKFKLNAYITLIISMILGRIVSGIVVWALVKFFAAKLPSPIVFIKAGIIKGLPGIIIHLAFIPLLVIFLKKKGIGK